MQLSLRNLPYFLPFPFRSVLWLCAVWAKPGLLWMAPSILESYKNILKNKGKTSKQECKKNFYSQHICDSNSWQFFLFIWMNNTLFSCEIASIEDFFKSVWNNIDKQCDW